MTWRTDAVADPERLVRCAAERSAALNPKNVWNDGFLGRALYRAGRYDEAVKRLGKYAALDGQVDSPYYSLFLALAHHGLGHAGEARTWLGKAEKALDRDLAKPSRGSMAETGLKWNQRLELSLLRREAEALIKEGRPLYLPVNVFQDEPAPAPPARHRGTSPCRSADVGGLWSSDPALLSRTCRLASAQGHSFSF